MDSSLYPCTSFMAKYDFNLSSTNGFISHLPIQFWSPLPPHLHTCLLQQQLVSMCYVAKKMEQLA